MIKKVLSAESWLKEKLRQDTARLVAAGLNFYETILNTT
jgi:hypothetical protein